MKSESPFQKVKKRFGKNFIAMAGLYLIVFAFLVSVFAYAIIPDNTPFANRMNLSLSNQSPGFNVTMIRIPKKYIEPSGVVETIFFGKKDEYDYIPISTCRFTLN